MKRKVHVVTHSHWDREWYFTKDDSDILLIENMDYLKELLLGNSSFSSYSFDGQISIVDDYLKIRPENKDALDKLINDRKLFVGPWYTQCDSLLINVESIVANLSYGTGYTDNFMKIGYLPDSFGQNAYLPSIFREFGIDNVVVQRGINPSDLNFYWESPNGRKIRSNYIYFGYGPGKFLTNETDHYNNTTKPMLDKLSDMSSDINLLLPSGGDQVLVNNNIPKIIEELNKMQDDYEFIHSNYEDFTKSVNFDNAPTYGGELLSTHKSRIHNTISSVRYDIKKLNQTVEEKLVYQLEPLQVIAKHYNFDSVLKWNDDIWKELFDAHSHDSIGGCNSDATNAQIIARLESLSYKIDNLIFITKKRITKSICQKLGKDNVIVLFNFNAKKTSNDFRLRVYSNTASFDILDTDGKQIEYTILNTTEIDGGKRVKVTAEGEVEEKLPSYYSHDISLDTTFNALGYQTFELVEKAGAAGNETSSVQKIENDYYAIYLENNKLNLLNKVNNEVIENFISFEDMVDDGDSYDFSVLKGDTPIIQPIFELVESKVSKHIKELSLKSIFKLNENRLMPETCKLDLEIFTTISLNESKNISVKHSVSNNIISHRLRTLINLPKDIKTDYSYALQGYGIIRRNSIVPEMENWRERGFAEAPLPVYKLNDMMYLKSDTGVMQVSSLGLKEYEVLENSLALTLFKSVELLGKDDLVYRPGRASGINNIVVKTDDARMLCDMSFSYTISLCGEAESPAILDDARNRYDSHHNQMINLFDDRLARYDIPMYVRNTLDSNSEIFKMNDNLTISRIKLAANGKDIILRIYNISAQAQKLDIEANGYEVSISNLKEDECGAYSNQLLERNDYITLKLRKK